MSHYVESLEGRRLFAAGTIDAAYFGVDGTATVRNFAAKRRYAAGVRQMLTDAAGRTLVVSFSIPGVTVARLTADGALDTSFATPQTNNQLVFDSTQRTFPAVALDRSNRLYVRTQGGVTRYTSRGKIDRTFGRRGFAGLSGSGRAGGLAVLAAGQDLVVDDQNRVWVAGAYGSASVGNGTSEKVIRLTSAGAFDATFDGDGVYDVPLPGPGGATTRRQSDGDLRLLDDGSVVFANTASCDKGLGGRSGVQVRRFTAAGALDPAYAGGVGQLFVGGAGRFGLDRVQPDGGVILKELIVDYDSGPPSSDYFYKKVSPAGDVVTEFFPNGPNNGTGDGGVPVNAEPLVTEPDGSRWVLGRNYQYGDELWHLLADGTPDPDFNGGDGPLRVTATAVGRDGSILYARDGDAGTPANTAADDKFAVTRLYPDEGPLAQLSAAVLTAPAADLGFTVVWRDDDGVNAATLDDNDLRVTGPNAFSATARLTGKTTRASGLVVATYRVTGPGGDFSAADNGLFRVSVRPTSVRDDSGVFAGAREIGTLTAAIT